VKQKQRKQPKETNTAYHEAGHAVADVRFELGCEGVTIIPRRDAGTLGHASCSDDAGAAKAEQKVISLLAGYTAQVEHDPACEAQARLGADGDFEEARNTLREHGAKRTLQPWLKKAREFVSNNWRAIEMVAHDLLETKKLDGTEVECIVDIADGKRSGAQELADYRNSRGLGPTSQFAFTVSSRTASPELTVRVPSPSNPAAAAPDPKPEGVRGHRGRKAAGRGDKETTA
jgi:ATP-dependent Zn protease